MKTEIKYGLIIGIGVSLWVLAEYLLGFHTTRMHIGRYTGYVASIIPIIALYKGIKHKRDADLNGSITFLQALRTGFLISLVSAVILAGFFALYNTVINPGWISKGIEFEKKALEKAGTKPEDMKKRLEEIKQYYSLQNQIIGVLTGTAINGVMLSAIISLFLRRKTAKSKEEAKEDKSAEETSTA